MKSTILLFLIALCGSLCAQPGAIDPSFNNNDVGFGFGDGVNGTVHAAGIQPDGKIIVGGNFFESSIARLNSDGSPDMSFNPGTGAANSTIMTMAIQPDGKIIIGGWFTAYNGTERNYIARLHADGSLDLSFNPGTGASWGILTTAIQPDGKIIIGGWFTSYNGSGRNYIARLNADGSLDMSFNPGMGTNSTVETTAIQPDGKIIIGGSFTSYNGLGRNYIARLNADGSLDTSFDPGAGANGTIRSTTIQPDGKIIIGGEFSSYNGTARSRIARLNADGTLDTGFNLGSGANDIVRTTAIQPDGKIIIGGGFTSYTGTGRNYIARLNADGSLDEIFNIGTGVGWNGSMTPVETIALQPNGKIIIGGSFNSYNGTTANNFARLNADGSLDATFNTGTGANSNVTSITHQSDGKIIIGGWFSFYNGTPINCIARLIADGSLDMNFNPGTGANSAVLSTAIQPDGKIIIGGWFTSYNGTGRNRIARLNVDGSLDMTFNPGTGANSNVNSIVLQPDGKIMIVGDFTSYNGTGRNRIARLNADGSLDMSFNPGMGANSTVMTVAIQPDGKIIIGGYFAFYNGTGRSRIARLNADGNLDMSFNPGTGVNNVVLSTSLQTDGKIIIAGLFTSYNGTGRNRIARLNADGSLDMSFNPVTGANDAVLSTAIQPDGKIIIGGIFTSYNGTGRNRIARLNADGSLDMSFNPGTGISGGSSVPSVEISAIQPDGKIIIGGGFTSYNGTGRNRIARIFGDCETVEGTDVITACNSYTWIDGATYTENNNSATFNIVGGAANGCDSLVTLNFTLLQPASGVDEIHSCSPITWIDGNTYSTSNNTATHLLEGAAQNGCDSLVTLNFTLLQPASGVDEISSCAPITWIDGNTYSTSNNTATHLLVGAAQNGCDSLVTLNLTINNSATGTDEIAACNSYTWIDGETYTESNNSATFNIVGGASNGCDSLVTLNLTINNSATGTDIITACNSYTWIDGETYTESNNSATFNIVGGAANGCDSLVTLNLTINNSATGTDVITACNSYTWIDGETYTESNNSATFNIVGGAANGCDSLVTLNLTINNSATGTDVITACNSYTWIDGETYTESNNSATFNIVGGASNGCDSLVTLNLTINNSSTGTNVITACNSYTWIDGVTYTESNNSATFNIVGGAANGCDSLVTLNLTINNSTTGTDVIVANNSYIWIDGNTYFADNNTATFNIVGGASNGCDSLVTLNLTIISGDAPSNNQPCGALNITSSGLTDLNTYAFLADMTCNNQSGNNTSASLGPVGASCGGTNGRSMWYTFTTPSCDVNGLVPFEIEFSTNNLGTNFNTKLAIFESDDNDCDGIFTELACNDDHGGAGAPGLCEAAGASSSTIVIASLEPNKQYWVYVDGFNAEFGDFVLSGRALTAPHGVAAVGNGTQIQLSTTDMGAGLYTYYYKQVGSTGHSTFNSASALTNVRTLAPGNDYITQIMYRCGTNAQQSQWYRTAPQTIALASTCAVVNDMTCAFNGDNSYTLSWTQPMGDLYTDGGLSGYRIKRNPVGSTGVYTFSNPAVICENGTCSVTLPGNSPTGFNWTIETRCSSVTFQVGNTTDCGPAPELILGNDGNNNTDKSMQHTFSFVNAEAGIEFVDVQMHDAYADFGLNTPMIGDYEMDVNSKNEITWRRVETAINTNFDFVIVPNPSNAMTTVHLNTVVEAGTFTIVDAMGRTINSGAISNTDNINFDAAQLQSGVYLVVVTVEGVQMTKRLVVAN